MMNANTIKVRFYSFDDVKKFVEVMIKYPGDADISGNNRNLMVDAKSILGVASLGLNTDLAVIFYDEITDEIRDFLAPYTIAA